MLPRGAVDEIEPTSSFTTTTSRAAAGRVAMRGGSVPPAVLSGGRARAGSVPPGRAAPLPRPITVESLAAQRAAHGGSVESRPGGLGGAGASASCYRRASIAAPSGTAHSAYRSSVASSTQGRSPKGALTASRRASLSADRPPSRCRSAVEQYRPTTPAYYRASGGSVTKVRSTDNEAYDGHGGTRRETVDVELPQQQESLSALASRTRAARDQLTKHRTLLDRYLPLHLDTPGDVTREVALKYSELVERMPQLEYNHRCREKFNESGGPPPTLIAPYRPAPRPTKLESSLPSISVRNSFTPKVSDVRKRARSVLCKIKGDARYFDFS